MSVRLTGTSGKLNVNGIIEGVSFNATSDYRKKKDITKVSKETFKDIITLPIVKYKYREDNCEKEYIGMIAQDVIEKMKDCSNLLIDQDDKGFYSIKESKLIYVLWGIVQELEKRLQDIESNQIDK